MKNWVIVIAILLAFVSCDQKPEEGKKPIAKIYDKYLYMSDLKRVIPESKTEEDSVQMAKKYIDNWIKKQLLLRKAEENLSDESKDIQKQIDEYKTSLLIYKYHQQLIDQKLDTAIKQEEIETYYEKNKSNFVLDKNLVKALFIKLPSNTPSIDNIKRWYKSDDQEDVSRLQDYCYRYAEKFDDFNDNWIIFDNLLNKIDHKIDNPPQFLKNNEFLEVEDSKNQYLIRIYEYKLKGETAPVSYVKDKIETLLINKRKYQLLEKLEKDLYNEALNKNEFEIY
ncbi:MAG: peptidyl-prolyl cis-trans isomerase [Bacteroidales bacterium]